MAEPVYLPAARVADVPLDTAKAVAVQGMPVLLVHTRDGLYAIENRCSHAEEPLACGRVKYGWISCPAHGARFDLETGEPLGPPATAPIRIFPVRIEDDMISVGVG